MHFLQGHEVRGKGIMVSHIKRVAFYWIRNKFLTVKMLKHWGRLPREIVDALSLEVLKASLGGAWSNMVLWKVSMPMGRG